MPVIRIPTPLRPYTGNQGEVAVAGSTVAEAMNDLVFQHPALKNHLYAEGGSLRPFVNLFLGEDSVRDLQGMETPLGENTRLMIIPSVAGGTI
jgi:molybdopterin converting factor small subunit